MPNKNAIIPSIYMSNLIEETIFNTKECLKIFRGEFKENLFAIISIGSLTTNHYLKDWSDIDLLIVLNNLSLKDKISISNIKILLEKKYKCHFGINVITKHEALTPILPEVSLDGKTLQGLLELSFYPQRLIYCTAGNANFFVPNGKIVRIYSLFNIAMFLLRNRKTLTSTKNTNLNKLKIITEKEVRASFIITKLAIQYRNNQTCVGYGDIIKQAAHVFPKFDFKLLMNNKTIISEWKKIRGRKSLMGILSETDKYIESFSKHVFNYSQKNFKV